MAAGTPRTSPRSAPGARTTAVVALLAGLLAGCAGGDAVPATAPSGSGGTAATSPTAGASEPAPAPPTLPSPTPAPAPTPPSSPTPPPDDRFVGAVFTPDYWPLPSYGEPAVPEGLGPLTFETATIAYRMSCLESERRIVGVDVGPDAAARRMAATLLEAAVVAHERWRSWFPSEDDCREESGNTISAHGYTEQVLLEEPCAFPDGPPLRCFLLVDLGYPAGAAHGYVRLDQLVFDAATGTRLTLAEVLEPTGLDVAGARDLVERIVAHLDGDGWEVELERARPTAEGLIISFAPYEAGPYSDGTRQLFVPWDVLTTPAD